LRHAERSCRLSSNALALVLAGGPEAAFEARSAVRLMHPLIGPELLPLIELLVSELVTNSVKHGGAGPDDPVRVELIVSDQVVRVEVSDLGPGFRPTPQPAPAPGRVGGWGLIMVDRSASRWGIRHGGRCVWFELERNGRSPTHSSDGSRDTPARAATNRTANNGIGAQRASSTLPRAHAQSESRQPGAARG
jgi:anti-sigma regulatory factor (Ser/Thr protein kinase)